ncbi:MAG: 5'/3'-nucleotidase SurE [Rikenellaceae bacterium]
MDKKLILVTNDDGYDAKGITALIEIARQFGHVVAVAPKTPQSGMSQAITTSHPLFLETIYKEEGCELYSFNGTPVDCVKFATDHLLAGRKIDLVLSGINHGCNATVNVLYSGTMGAAIEGSFYAPSIGLSLDNHSPSASLEGAIHYSRKIIADVMEAAPEIPFCLNVNVPDIPLKEIKGARVCRQNRGYWVENFFSNRDPRGRDYYWLTGEYVDLEPEATDSDMHALRTGYVAVVPIQVDMTAYHQMEMVNKIIK